MPTTTTSTTKKKLISIKKSTKKVKITKKIIKRVNNNLMFAYTRNAIKYGIGIIAYYSSLYYLKKIILQHTVFRQNNRIEQIDRMANIIANRMANRIEQIDRNPLNRRQFNDVQNVHDRQVNQQSIQIYNRYPVPREDRIHLALNAIRRAFINDNRIINVLDQIIERNRGEIRNRQIMGLNKTELQCLVIVWINVATNLDKKNYFAQMLRDCLDGRNIVCQTGVVNRIVVALIVDNPDAIPRNFRLEFQNELQNLAIRIRNQVMNNNNLQTDEQRTNEFQTILRRQAYEDYAENTNITRPELNQILEPLLEACC